MPRVLATFVIVAAIWLASAGAAESGTQVACFRILHASPDAGNIDVYINRTRVAEDIAYTQFSQRRWCIAATIALARAFPAGADPNATPPLVSSNVTMAFGRSYVIAIADRLQQLQVVVLENPTLPPVGRFSLRVAHLAIGIGGLDLAVTGGPLWLSGVVFPTAQTTTQPAGRYALELREAGTPNVLASLGESTFRSRERKTIYVLAPSAAADDAGRAVALPVITLVEPDR
ncbi:MAG: DUF4397 domain-containing protein [Thermoflexales bacterium]|nr:DUF4397 domain-containing protein [Thermoflexales bacterium]